MNPVKSIFTSFLFIILICFIWYTGFKPLYINQDINTADRYARIGKCDKAVNLMRSKVIYSSSTIDSYAKLKYISIIEQCNARSVEAIEVLKEVAWIRPYYTRTYLFLGNYTGDKSYFDKAEDLSPNHEEIFVGRAKIDFSLKDYDLTLQDAQKCIDINPVSRYCWWLKILSNSYLGNIQQVRNDFKITLEEKDIDFSSKTYLKQIEVTCEINENEDCYNFIFENYKRVWPKYSQFEERDEYRELLINSAKKANRLDEAKKY